MNENKNILEYLPELLERLKKIDPLKIMIFGSCAGNSVDVDSDLDLLIVVNQDVIPGSYDEKLEIKLRVRKAIREINKKIPIDLFVYTKPEYDYYSKNQSSFFKEIHESGRILYEKAS